MALGQGGDPRGSPLGERVIMQTPAQHVGLPFVDLDPLKIDAKLAPQLSVPSLRATTGSARHRGRRAHRDRRRGQPLDHALVEARSRPSKSAAIRSWSWPTPSDAPAPHHRLLRISRRGRRRGTASQRRRRHRQPRAIRQVANRVEEIEASVTAVTSSPRWNICSASRARPTRERCSHRTAPRALERPHADRRRVAQRPHLAHKVVHAAVVSRIKTLARLDIAEEAPPAGRTHQDSAGRARSRNAGFDNRGRVRGKARPPHLRPERASSAIGSSWACSAAPAAGGRAFPRAPARPHPRHRADR